MAGVFQNIDPPPPSFCAGGGRTNSLRGEGVGGVQDDRHSSVLYVWKYFVLNTFPDSAQYLNADPDPALYLNTEPDPAQYLYVDPYTA